MEKKNPNIMAWVIGKGMQRLIYTNLNFNFQTDSHFSQPQIFPNSSSWTQERKSGGRMKGDREGGREVGREEESGGGSKKERKKGSERGRKEGREKEREKTKRTG